MFLQKKQLATSYTSYTLYIVRDFCENVEMRMQNVWSLPKFQPPRNNLAVSVSNDQSNVNSSRNVFLVDIHCCKQGIGPLNSYRYLYVTELVRTCESIMVASAKRVRITPRERKGGSMGEILRTRKRHRSDYLKVRISHKR